MPAGYGPDRATPAYEVVEWVLTGLAVIAVCLRIYSRGFLTRSIGSDDFAICIPAVLATVGAIGTSIQVHAGVGRHQSTLPVDKYGLDQKWETIDWLAVFVSYFFVRTSIMLFVLRLLPSFKQWQQKVIYGAMVVNLAITLVAMIIFGLSCVPLKALWENGGQLNVPGAKCYPMGRRVVVQQVNGILSCLVDFVTAIVPQFLLWKVQMRPRTKRILNIIFALGLATAAMSIGRAATTTSSTLTVDSTWRILPSKWFATIEEKFGIIFACAPALRQFLAYRARTGTFSPFSTMRQDPNEDFKRMRRRITLRDVFWFTRASATDGRVIDARPIMRRTNSGQTKLSVDVEAAANKSMMDKLEERAAQALGSRRDASSDGIASSSGITGTPCEIERCLTTPRAGDKRITNIGCS